MAARPNDEFEGGAFALDHLHTRTPELAGHASKVNDDARGCSRQHLTTGSSTPGARAARQARRKRVSSFGALGAALCAVLLGGGAMLTSAGSAHASPQDPAANTVRAVIGAPSFGPGTGQALNANFVDLTATPTGHGYWTVASDGGVFSFGDARFHGSTGGIALAAPIVGMASTPTGGGYWLVGRDGGVFSYGDATFHGSVANRSFSSLIAPIVAIAATPDGGGYWLVGADGAVFAFGNATFQGAATSVPHGAPIVAIARTHSGYGYYLLAADGGVFAFGDARFRGSAVDGVHVATGIAVPSNGRGYFVSRSDGEVVGFGGAPSSPAPFDPSAATHPVVAITSRQGGGAWLALSYSPPLPTVDPASQSPSQDPFLKCTRAHESDSAGGYHARSSDGLYYGAYQFLRSTWNNTARAAGRPDLVGVDPSTASPADQDQLALFLFHQSGPGPWGGRCAGMP